MMDTRDRDMVLRPLDWSRWPLLPMKRTVDGRLECGFLFGDDEPWRRIYVGSIYAVGQADPKPETWREALAGHSVVEYASLDALLAEWRVD